MYILLGVVVFLLIVLIALYNGLVSIRNHCDQNPLDSTYLGELGSRGIEN